MTWQDDVVSAASVKSREGSTAPQRILQRAIEVIEESGEAGIRTNPIAAECGVTPPILYRAFKSREGLIIAAQSERYRRASEVAAEFLCERIESGRTKDELVQNFSSALDYVFADQRTAARLLRTEVIGSAVSRPELREKIVEIDRAYANQIAASLTFAYEQGWIRADVNLEAVTMWGLALVNSRLSIEFDGRSDMKSAWNQFSKRAIIDALFS